MFALYIMIMLRINGMGGGVTVDSIMVTIKLGYTDVYQAINLLL